MAQQPRALIVGLCLLEGMCSIPTVITIWCDLNLVYCATKAGYKKKPYEDIVSYYMSIYNPDVCIS